MQLIHTEVLIQKGPFAESAEWQTIQQEIAAAIQAVVWPPGSPDFAIYPVRQANGVVPIKAAFLETLYGFGWRFERNLPVVEGVRPGPIDAIKETRFGVFAVEWETGNISSSHRAINKIALGMLQGHLVGGTLVLPTRTMYEFLTDRVGNYREIFPYFPMWKRLCDENGVLTAIAVEHDREDANSPPIRKGTDGRALR